MSKYSKMIVSKCHLVTQHGIKKDKTKNWNLVSEMTHRKLVKKLEIWSLVLL